MVRPVSVCGNSQLPLAQGELEAQIGRRINLLPIPPRVHCSERGDEVDLLLWKGDPAVGVECHSVTSVKGMDISQGNVHLRISIK